VERSVFRDTRENTNYSTGYGVAVQPNQDDFSPATVSLEGVVLEDNRTAALLVVGSSASLDASVIRFTQPSDLSSRDGVGIIAQNEGASGSVLSVSGSVFYENHSRGIAVVASSATVEATAIHDTQPQEWDDNTGEAMAIIDADGIAADAIVELSTFDRNFQSGVFVRGSTATLTSVLIRDTEPRRSDGAFGRGIAVVGQPEDGLLAAATIDSCGIFAGHAFGIYVADGSATIESTLVEQVAAQVSDDANGDALAVITMDLPGETVNTLSPDISAEFEALILRAEKDTAVKAVVFTSGMCSMTTRSPLSNSVTMKGFLFMSSTRGDRA
jgi:hypothetical protein